jgi:hypothetical protein
MLGKSSSGRTSSEAAEWGDLRAYRASGPARSTSGSAVSVRLVKQPTTSPGMEPILSVYL